MFEEAIETFGNDITMQSFVKIKTIKGEISKKIKELEPKKKADFMSSMAKIDTFINTINMQLSNPAMASAVASFAGTYVSQMLAEVVHMQSIC